MILLAHIDVDIPGVLTLGDVVVGAGTIALAAFTARLANETHKSDQRNAARERKRRERQVRGIARLVDGELAVIRQNVEAAIRADKWRFSYGVPHGGWDRGGAIIAETVAEDEAFTLITLFSDLSIWETAVADQRARAPGVDGMSVPAGSGERAMLDSLQGQLSEGRTVLEPIAYPDARDLEPDPDDELAYRRRTRFLRRIIARVRSRASPR